MFLPWQLVVRMSLGTTVFSWLLNTLVIWWLGGGLWFVGWGNPWLGYGYLVLHYFYMAVWHVQGAPPLEVDATILVLNAFGIGCLASCLKITFKIKVKVHLFNCVSIVKHDYVCD